MGQATTKAKLTKRAVDAAAVPAKGEPDARVWDTELKGFFLRVYSTGRKVYAVKCRVNGRQCIHTIGVHGSPWTPDKARGAADEALRLARSGTDPSAERKAAREALTVAELVKLYIGEGPATKPAKRASTWATDASNLNRHIVPLLGRRIANEVTKADAARAVRDISTGKTAKTEKSEKKRGVARVTGGEGTARRTRITAAAMFAWGVEHGYVAGNPFAAVKLGAPPVRERFLSTEEVGRLLDALMKLEAEAGLAPAFADATRLLLLTGARKSEILELRWSEVDFERKLLSLPPERTKAGGKTGVRRINLAPAALSILSRRLAAFTAAATAGAGKASPLDPRSGEFVFPAVRGDGGHAIGLRRAFKRVCKVAKLEGVRLHDLRHTFASLLVAQGQSLFLVSKLLGHANARTTERYAHLASDPLQLAVEGLASVVMPEPADRASLGGEATGSGSGSGAKLVPLRPRSR